MKKNIFLTLIILQYFNLFSQTTPLNDIALQYLNNQTVSYPVKFVVLGDNRPECGNLCTEIDADFIVLMNQIREISPDFVINIGDLIMLGTEEQYAGYYNYIFDWMCDVANSQANPIPYFSVPGNHEFWCVGSYARYPQYIGDYKFSFDYGNCRMVGVNNVQHEDDPLVGPYHLEPYYISNDDLLFVENEFNDVNSPVNKFGFTHAPLIRWDWINNPNFQGYSEYYNILINNNVKANFHGHIHDYYRKYDCNGLFDITTGGAGSDTWGNYDPPVTHINHHFLLVTVTEDNNVKVEMYFINEGHSETAKQFDFYMPGSSDLILQNQIILYSESKTYIAQNTIEVAGNGTEFVAEAGSNVEIIAGERIVLKDGFHAKQGCNFRAYLQNVDCENVNNSKKSSKQTGDYKTEHIIENTNKPIIINRQNSASIFPNPSSGIFTIYFTEKPKMLSKIEITDLNGKTIYSNEKAEITEKDYFILNLSDQTEGVYFLKLNYNNSIFTKKIIIQN